MLLFAVFFTLCDIFKVKLVNAIFLPIGRNALAIYIAARFLIYPITLQLVATQTVANLPLAIVAVMSLIVIQWLALRFCYQRSWFFSV